MYVIVCIICTYDIGMYICFHTVPNDEPILSQVSKQLMIHQLPPILILHMKRFDIGFDVMTKDDRHISFPEILDMAPYCTFECIKVRMQFQVLW